MGIMKLFLVWFIVNLVLGFMLVSAWIIPGVNFVAGPISLVIVSLVNLIFFIIAIVKFFDRIKSVAGFCGNNCIENFLNCKDENRERFYNWHSTGKKDDEKEQFSNWHSSGNTQNYQELEQTEQFSNCQNEEQTEQFSNCQNEEQTEQFSNCGQFCN